MKHILGIALVVVALAFTQGCKKERSAEEVAAIAKAKADSTDSAQVAERDARRARFDEMTAMKQEKRRIAAEAAMKKGNPYKDAKGKMIYIKADEMPTYSGGEAEMMKFLQKNVQYPQSAKENGEEGTVFVDFVIDKSGQVIDVAATDSVNSDVNQMLKDEATRVVSSMPKWTPAKEKGKPVAVAYNIPIKFQLEE